MQPNIPDAKTFAAHFEPHGNTDWVYLTHHYRRFATTLEEFCSSWELSRGKRVLDIGAHWLHQAILWKQAGFDVIAVDMPITFEMTSVQSLAHAHDIELIPCHDLEVCTELDALPDSSVDVILFTEIIEHITFNPVKFWKQVHRILAPNGRLLVTTPNYYAWNGRAWDFMRFLRGFAGGLSVDGILNTRTHAHHWREFSKHELVRYFGLLSPDFRPSKVKAIRGYYAAQSTGMKKLVARAAESIPVLRPNLHLEIDLHSKENGIVIEPGW